MINSDKRKPCTATRIRMAVYWLFAVLLAVRSFCLLTCALLCFVTAVLFIDAHGDRWRVTRPLYLHLQKPFWWQIWLRARMETPVHSKNEAA